MTASGTSETLSHISSTRIIRSGTLKLNISAFVNVLMQSLYSIPFRVSIISLFERKSLPSTVLGRTVNALLAEYSVSLKFLSFPRRCLVAGETLSGSLRVNAATCSASPVANQDARLRSALVGRATFRLPAACGAHAVAAILSNISPPSRRRLLIKIF